MAKSNYIQFRVSEEQKFNIKTSAAKHNQTVTDYIMSAIIEFEKRNLGRQQLIFSGGSGFGAESPK